jgi:hypothetical protein
LLLLGVLWLPKLGDHLLPLRMGGGFSLAMLSPAESLPAGADTDYKASQENFWNALFVSHLVGCFFLTAGALSIARNWRHQKTDSRPDTVMAPAPASSETPRAPVVPRRRLDPAEPVSWRASQLPGQRALLWLAAILGTGNWISWTLIYVFGSPVFSRSGFFGGMIFAADFGSAALFAWAASRFFLQARRTGELELLMSTPVGARQIITGQWVALWARLRWPLAFMVCSVGLPVLLSSLPRGFGLGALGFPAGMIRSVVSLANLILSVMAVCWMAMWLGLRSRNSWVAVTWAVGLVKGLPWLMQNLCYLALAVGGQILGGSRGGVVPLGYMLVYLLLPVLVLVANLFYIGWARKHLQQELAAGAVFDLRRSVRESPAELLALFRRFRHWTPP